MTLRNITTTLICCLLITSYGIAQEIQINPFAGYQLGGKLKLDGSDIKFDNGPNFGLAASKGFDGKNMELSYTHFISAARLVQNGTGTELNSSTVHIGYIQAGLVQDFLFGDEKLVPFVLVTLGSTYIKLTDFSGSDWGFSIGAGAGLKYFFTDAIGIRVQGRFLLPMYFSGYCSWGYCTGSYSVIPQGEFSGGLVFRFDK